MNTATATNMLKLCNMIKAGASAADVAAFIVSLPMGEGQVRLSHFIEERSWPGTFAEAVFEILAN